MKGLSRNGVASDFTDTLEGYSAFTKANFLDWACHLMRYAVVIVAFAFIAVYVTVALLRIGYPYELEWMEGGSVDHVRRVLEGKKLYVAPSLDFTPFIYPPLYYYLSAAISTAVGVGFEPLRLVSFLSSLGAFLFIFLIIKRETNHKVAGIISTGLFAATYQISGTWFDTARVDSLHLFLMLAGVYVLRFHGSGRSWVLAGLLIALSYFAKQSALSVMIPLILYAIVKDWQRSVSFVGGLSVTAAGGTFLLNVLHGGWFTFYIFDLPLQHEVVHSVYLEFWTKDLLLPLPIATIAVAFYLFSQMLKLDKDRLLFYGLLAAGMVGEAWFLRLHSGGWLNVLIPAYVAISILFGLAIHSAVQYVRSESGRKRRLTELFLGALVISQLAMLFYNPSNFIPSPRDRDAGEELITIIGSFEGEVFVPNHGYLPALAGKNTYAQGAAVADILRSKDEQLKALLSNEISTAIRSKRFSSIIMDTEWFWYKRFAAELKQYYMVRGPVFSDPSTYWPITGWRTRPEVVYVPRPDAPSSQ